MLMNARMYSVSSATKSAWQKLFSWVRERSGMQHMQWLEHEPPKLISDMWTRSDLCCAMMCGLPVALRQPAPIVLAGIIPSPDRYQGKSIYMTDLAVRLDSPFTRLEDTFGGVAGYTVPDSQSGYFAFRYRLASSMQPGRHLYRKAVGGLLNARGIINALVKRDIDVGPLDGYVYDLLCATEPEFAHQVRVIETTPPTPLPPIVATAPLEAEQIAVLRASFMEAGNASELAECRETLLIKGFCLPEVSGYQVLRERAKSLENAPLPWPESASQS